MSVRFYDNGLHIFHNLDITDDSATAMTTAQQSKRQSLKTCFSRVCPQVCPWSKTNVVQPAINILRRCKTTLQRNPRARNLTIGCAVSAGIALGTSWYLFR